MKKLLSTFAILALVASSAFAKVPDISLDDLKKAIAEDDVVLVDVNGTDSYKEGHIPGAIDYIAVKEDFAAKLPAEKDTLIVAYCGSPQCPAYAKAAKAATDLGYTNVKRFAGGISGWKEAGEPTEKAE